MFRERNVVCQIPGLKDPYLRKVGLQLCDPARQLNGLVELSLILEPLSKKYLTELPTDFFINLILCLTLGVFSLTFFFLNRDDDDDLEDEFGPEPGA